MPHYIRAFVPGGTFFFTVAILERRQQLLTEHVDLLRNAFSAARARRPFRIDAIVILPDHLHCIWTLPLDDADFSSRWHQVKAGFSRGIDKGERLSQRRREKGERGYIHYNPVKHGHARCAADWPHSSFHRFVAEGILAPDWAAGDEVKELGLE
jgi:putative transposase